MTLRGLIDEGEIVDPEDSDEDIERSIMVLVAPENCIGCGACNRVCPKNCQTHAPAEA